MKKNISVYLLVLLLSLFTLFPLLRRDFFPVHDNTQVQRVFEMKNALADGMFPVRWVENLGYGYGYPIFNFYSPLPYYIGGAINLVGLESLLATKLMFIIGILLAAFSMYIFVSSFFGRKSGILASVIYLYFPYHAVNIYIRGAVGEFYAYAFLPLFFWGIFKLYSCPKKITYNNSSLYVIVSGVSFAFIALSHNLSVFMLFFIYLIFIIGVLVFSKKKRDLFICYVAVLVLGIALSSFYVLPAFLEMKYTNVSSQLVVGGSNFSDHFVCLGQLWDSVWGFGGSVKGCADGISFKLGKLNVALFAFAIIYFIYILIKKKKVDLFLPGISIVLLLLSVSMTLEPSKFVWQSIPFMPYIQYPWRFLNFVALFLSFLSGFLFYNLDLKNKLFGKLLLIGLILFTLFFNVKLFSPVKFEAYNKSHYIDTTYIRWTTSKISDEYLPPNFDKPKNINELPTNLIEAPRGESDMQIISKKTGYIKAHYNNANDAKIQINKAYFPGWKAFIDGKAIQIIPFQKGMYLEISKGEGILELKFIQTPLEKMGNIISFFGFVLIITAIIYRVKAKKYG